MGESGLPDSGLAQNHDEPTATSVRRCQSLANTSQIRLASDEADVGRDREGPRIEGGMARRFPEI